MAGSGATLANANLPATAVADESSANNAPDESSANKASVVIIRPSPATPRTNPCQQRGAVVETRQRWLEPLRNRVSLQSFGQKSVLPACRAETKLATGLPGLLGSENAMIQQIVPDPESATQIRNLVATRCLRPLPIEEGVLTWSPRLGSVALGSRRTV